MNRVQRSGGLNVPPVWFVWHHAFIHAMYVCVPCLSVGHATHATHATHETRHAVGRATHTWTCVAWPTDMCDMSHWRVWHDSLTCVTWVWLISVCCMSHSRVWYDSFTYETGGVMNSPWIYHLCFICVTSRSRTCGVCVSANDARVSLDSCTCVTWLSHLCDMTHSRMHQVVWWSGT